MMNLCGRGDKDIFTVARASRGRSCERRPHRPRASPTLQAQRAAPALVTFVTAGDPDLRDLARRSSQGLPTAGADVIELGMPFTDPMADGPAIQAAGLRALKAGQTHEEDAGAGARLPRRPTTTRRSC